MSNNIYTVKYRAKIDGFEFDSEKEVFAPTWQEAAELIAEECEEKYGSTCTIIKVQQTLFQDLEIKPLS